MIALFIKKNTKELKDKIESFGYAYAGSDNSTWGTSALFVNLTDRKYYEVYPAKPARDYRVVDCCDNEQLFLAIIALSEDTDRDQWFYSTGWTTFDGDPLPDNWVLCDQNTLKHFAWVNNSPNSYSRDIWKKATIDELISHFH